MRPRVTERPKPPEFLGATITVHPVSSAPSRVGRPCNGHRAAVLVRTPRPVTGPPEPVAYGPTAPLEETVKVAFRPLCCSLQDFGGASVSRTKDTLIGVVLEVKS